MSADDVRPLPDAERADDDDGTDGRETATEDDTDARRFQPSIPQVIALAVALIFTTAVVTAWWTSRDPKPNDVDVGFYDDMITHHHQAIGMAITYLRNGTDPVLGFVAGRINSNQNGDVRQMAVALHEWNRTGNPDVAMEWMGAAVPQSQMPGMATPEEMEALDQARGAELDDMFSRLMIEHHRGGIHMADEAAANGDLSSTLAAGMAAVQRDEVEEINLRREQLGLERI
jgi:uncharacterized protein (DUF305 family)